MDRHIRGAEARMLGDISLEGVLSAICVSRRVIRRYSQPR